MRAPARVRTRVISLERGGNGSHRNFRHRRGVNITVSGKTGDDAKGYQVRDVKKAIELVSDEEE